MTGKEVKRIRARLGLTQAQLAEKLGVARVTVARWEVGLLGIRETTARLLKIIAKDKADYGNSAKASRRVRRRH
jgi:DNA-binding transcriptional regulator YiaG